MLWFLSSEVANLRNFRVWPGGNARWFPGQSLRENRFSDPKCGGPLLQTLPLKIGRKREKRLIFSPISSKVHLNWKLKEQFEKRPT